jgi:hypothetical protein
MPPPPSLSCVPHTAQRPTASGATLLPALFALNHLQSPQLVPPPSPPQSPFPPPLYCIRRASLGIPCLPISQTSNTTALTLPAPPSCPQLPPGAPCLQVASMCCPASALFPPRVLASGTLSWNPLASNALASPSPVASDYPNTALTAPTSLTPQPTSKAHLPRVPLDLWHPPRLPASKAFALLASFALDRQNSPQPAPLHSPPQPVSPPPRYRTGRVPLGPQCPLAFPTSNASVPAAPIAPDRPHLPQIMSPHQIALTSRPASPSTPSHVQLGPRCPVSPTAP